MNPGVGEIMCIGRGAGKARCDYRAFVPALICMAGLSFSADRVFADTRTSPAWTIYQGQGVDSNLVNVLPKLVKGNPDFEKSYFTGLGYYRPFETPQPLQRVFGFLGIPGTITGAEVMAVKHHGLQNNWESDVTYNFRFPKLHISELTIGAGFGLGMSYAFGRPSYEDGPAGDPDRRYRLQHYHSYELEWGVASAPSTTLVTRIHHRSGLYGVIAPPRVGSNFLTVGLRHSF